MNYKLEMEKIAIWMKDYNEKAGTNGYVCGISGGIDSAITTYISLKAVGKSNFIGIYLPCESSPNMEEDAIQLAQNLGIELRIFNLINSYNAIIKELETGGETVTRLTKANTKARLRMTMLFAIANQYNYLLTGTGNKSELEIGYCTFGGDSVVSIEPLGNYYKTEVYKMANLIPEIPENIKIKAPSADLWENQSDEEEIEITYELLDKILQHYDEEYGWDVGINYGKYYTYEDFNKVKKMVEKAEYKNKVPPRYERN